MTLRLRYTPPQSPAAPVTDPDNAVYALGAAGATAAVELSEGYRLPLGGATGVAELRQYVERLLGVLRSGAPLHNNDDLRGSLPNVLANAVLHSWHFSSYMVELPVIVFAIEGPVTRVYTRTLSEAPGMPLVVAEGDLADAVEVPTSELIDEAQTFLDQVARDAAKVDHEPPSQ